ncbi:MAG: glycosyltransferase family 2 protein [Phycisphaerae bacterium]|nr:glycosyltransferase family 2 protein [Phycisphaerae bacterium]
MGWEWYNWIAILLLACQGLFLYQSWRNFRYAIHKSRRTNEYYHPRVLLTVPCKGIDDEFAKNIASVLDQVYPDFVIHFVIEDASDPAFEYLNRLVSSKAGRGHACRVEVLIAGKGQECSQKIHNLLYSCHRAPDGTQIFAFADSDACLPPNWLNALVYPLRKDRCGATTGYRWFVPRTNNLATLALSAINAKVAQLLGNTMFNHLWGGSMAVRTDLFGPNDLERIWRNAISDDLGLSYAVKKTGRKVSFVPECLVASYEQTTWKGLFEFARRQFLITRIVTPGTWRFGLFAMIYSLLGSWGGLGMLIYGWLAGIEFNAVLWGAVPAVFLAGNVGLAILRQRMIRMLLPGDAATLRAAARADVWGTLAWSWLLFVCILSSAFGRTITWRGIRYRLLGPDHTQVLTPRSGGQ